MTVIFIYCINAIVVFADLLKGILVVFKFQVIMNKAIVNIYVLVFMGIYNLSKVRYSLPVAVLINELTKLEHLNNEHIFLSLFY